MTTPEQNWRLQAFVSAQFEPITNNDVIADASIVWWGRMGEVVNLRTERKRAARLRNAEVAAQKRTAHGVSKQQRTLATAVEHKASRTLDQQRLDSGEGQ